MKANELREMSDEQLEVELNQAQAGLFHLKVKAQTDTLNAPSEIRRHRRLIARIRTIQRQREVAGNSQAAESAQAEA